MKELVKALFLETRINVIQVFVVFVETAMYRYRVVKVTDLVGESYRVVAMEVAESKKKIRVHRVILSNNG